jgi:hypothetical protein
MTNSRRAFLQAASSVVIGSAGAPAIEAQSTTDLPPGAPPAFNTGPASGPAVKAKTFAEAEKLAQVNLTDDQRTMAAASWRTSMAPLYERRTGPRRVALEATLPPWSNWNPSSVASSSGPSQNRFVRSAADPGPVAASDEDIAFAPVAQLSRWIEGRQLTAERLVRVYLQRLRRFDPKLRCVITRMDEHALRKAREADAEIASGRYRGPLHGIPWGAKDLLDTAGIPTTYGAEPFRNRVPREDSAVVKRLDEAGAILIAKLSLGLWR